jgi:hypothetical protein
MFDDINDWINNEVNILENIELLEDFNINDNINIEWVKLDKINPVHLNNVYNITPTNDIMKFQIKLNKLENLNKFLDKCQICVFINDILNYNCSIRSLILLAEKIFNLKIVKDNKYFLIPIVLFLNINININSKLYINIYFPTKCKFEMQLNADIKIKNKFISFAIIGHFYLINNSIGIYNLGMRSNTLGLIICPKLYNDDAEFLEPSILKPEMTMYKNNIKFVKEVDIEKIKINDQIKYFISTNKLNFNQIFNYSGSFDDFIVWENHFDQIGNHDEINIHWSNYHDNCYCEIEKLIFMKKIE